jgi:hypothetical protein
MAKEAVVVLVLHMEMSVLALQTHQTTARELGAVLEAPVRLLCLSLFLELCH